MRSSGECGGAHEGEHQPRRAQPGTWREMPRERRHRDGPQPGRAPLPRERLRRSNVELFVLVQPRHGVADALFVLGPKLSEGHSVKTTETC